ncbi:two-component system, chemotaxis family, response regulator WspR [Azospirillaceae bacterium]
MTIDKSVLDRNKPVIMIIDDVLANIYLLRACLTEEYSIIFATSGMEGIGLIRSQSPDIVLLDLMMPEMDGYEVCAALQSDPETSDIPIIFVTTQGEDDDEAKGLSLGAVDYVTKPFVPAIVKARVRVHIELKRLHDRLKHLSSTDGLTGLANRRIFDESLKREWSRGLRAGTPLSLVMIDIDFFKNFNDFYGHLGGDDCLRKVTGALAAAVPRLGGDLVARYGGEEFAVLLVDTDRDGALTVSERLRASVADLAIPHERSVVAGTVTVSIGAASVFPDNGHAPISLIALADSQLYRAKKGGRNRVMVMGD